MSHYKERFEWFVVAACSLWFLMLMHQQKQPKSKVGILLKDWYLCTGLLNIFKTVSDLLTLSGTVFFVA